MTRLHVGWSYLAVGLASICLISMLALFLLGDKSGFATQLWMWLYAAGLSFSGSAIIAGQLSDAKRCIRLLSWGLLYSYVALLIVPILFIVTYGMHLE